MVSAETTEICTIRRWGWFLLPLAACLGSRAMLGSWGWHHALEMPTHIGWRCLVALSNAIQTFSCVSRSGPAWHVRL